MRDAYRFFGTWIEPESERVHIVEFLGIVDSASPGTVYVDGEPATRCGITVPLNTHGGQRTPTCEQCLFGELDDVLEAFGLAPAGVLVGPDRIGAPS